MAFGCLKEAPSLRNYNYEAVCGAADTNIPETYTLPKKRTPTVQDQGENMDCVARVCVGMIEVFHRMEFGTKKEYSPGFFYGYNREDKDSYKGMYPQKALKHFLKTGSVPLSMFNKTPEMPEARNLVKGRKDLAKEAEKTRIKGFTAIERPAENTAKVKAALYKSGYPLIGISDSYFGGSHAVLIIGYAKNSYVVQNSWGRKWGVEGRKNIPFDAINYVYILTDEVFEMKFLDVKKDAWYHDVVKEATFSGILQGVSETAFEPDRSVTRAELAQFGVNICKKLEAVLEGLRKE